MGERGPSKKSTEDLRIEGSWRGRVRDETRRRVASGHVIRPRYLQGYAATIWGQIAPWLRETRALAPTDTHALARYCATLARWRKAYLALEQLEDEVYEIVTQHGSIRAADPHVSLEARLSASLDRQERQFGLTPRSRPDVLAPVPDDDTDAESLLSTPDFGRAG